MLTSVLLFENFQSYISVLGQQDRCLFISSIMIKISYPNPTSGISVPSFSLTVACKENDGIP